jgi:thiol-disulfide isomerase/thioredoxin
MVSKLLLLIVGWGALVSSFAAPLQSRDGAAKQTIVVHQVDLAGFKKLLYPDPKSSRPLLVNFWATWCDPCRDEFPDLVKIDEDYRSKGLDFIAISLDDPPDIKTEVPKFLQQMHASMPAYLLNVSDPEPAINLVDPKWGGSLPATFLYDAEGKVVFKHFGRIHTADLRAAIDKVITGK